MAATRARSIVPLLPDLTSELEEDHNVVHRRSFRVASAAFALALLAAACGGGDDDDSGIETDQGGVSAGTADTVEVQEGGTVVLAGEQEPTGLNWLQSEDNAAWTSRFMQLVWPAVSWQLPDGSFVPQEQFVSYELTSEDPQTVEYTINSDAVWSDGTPITADDFVFTWESQNACEEAAAAADPNTVYNAAGCQGYDVMESVEGSGDDNKTVTVTFAEPYADWEALFDPIFPAHGFEAAGNGDPVAGFNTGFKIENLPSGEALADYVLSGSWFVVTDYQPGVSTTLERNEDYWGDDAAMVDTLLIRWITEGTQQAPALQNGEVDVIFPQAQLDLVEQVRAIPTATTFIGFGTFWEHVDLNQANPHLGDLAVRQAIALGMNREEIVERLPAQFDPAAQVLNNRIFFPSDERYVDNSGDYGTQDTEGAKALLEGAGYTLGPDGVYTHPERGRLSVRITWRDPNERRQSTAQLIQAQLKEAGMEVTFAPQPDFEFLDQRNFDMALFGWTGGTTLAGTDSIYRSDGGQNYTGNNNPEIDSLYDQANVELDADTRTDLMNQADEQIWADMATIPLFQVPELLANDQEIGNVIYNGYGNQFTWNSNQWGQVAQ
jgi:peptide/nickel transport system substrate-binding protein